MNEYKFNFNEELNIYREKIKIFLKNEVINEIDKWENNNIIPYKDILLKMGKEKLLGVRYLTKNHNFNPFYFHCILAEELAKIHSGSFSMGITIHNDMVLPMIKNNMVNENLEKIALEAIDGKILFSHAISEENAGTDLQSISTTYQKLNNTFIINGKKTNIALADIADYHCVLATNIIPSKNKIYNMSLFLIKNNTKGIQIIKRKKTIGHQAISICDIVFNNVEINDSLLIGKEGNGLIIQMNQFYEERILSAWRATAMSEYYFSQTIDYMKKYYVFNKLLIENQYLLFESSKLATDIAISKALNFKAVELLLTQNKKAREYSSYAKYLSSVLVNKIADFTLQQFASKGYSNLHPIGRFYKDSRLLSISTGSNEAMLLSISKLKGWMKNDF
jgi:citronellyl-CoA dehydrogenase